MSTPSANRPSHPAGTAEWRVLLFGPEAAACGKNVVTFQANANRLSVVELKEHLRICEPALSRFLVSGRIAANHAFVADDHALTPQDELALIGTVSGG